jgi:hypothetical protein
MYIAFYSVWVAISLIFLLIYKTLEVHCIIGYDKDP